MAEAIEPPPRPQPACRDADHDEVLALAVAAQVEIMVSGDNDLLSMKCFEGIPIITAREAVARLEARGKT